MMKGKNYELDFVKLLFAIGIFVYHSMYLEAADGNPKIFAKGYLGVEFFFMVSGYLMALSIMKAQKNKIEISHFEFVKRKAVKLYPYILSSFVLNFIIWNFFVKTPSVGYTLKSAMFSLGELSLIFTSGIKFTNHLIHGASWYVSSMLIAMFVLYPIMKKNLKRFSTYIAPVIAVVSYAFLSNNMKQLSSYDRWLHVGTEGVIRALAGVSLGTVVFAVCLSIENSDRKLTKFGRYAASAAELMIFAVLILLMDKFHVSEYKSAVDFTVVLLIFFLLIIILSESNCYHQIFSKKFFVQISKFSAPLYFSHRCWTRFISAVLPDLTFAKQFALYAVLSVLTAVIVIPVSRRIANAGRYFKDKFIQEKSAAASLSD